MKPIWPKTSFKLTARGLQMPSPDRFQDGFIASILNPELATPLGLMNPMGEVSDKRFNVYRNNVTMGLLGAMSDAFPIVEKLVGQEFFREMARIYVRQSPPKNPLMMFYGDDFPEFIEGFPPARSVPYLADIARLEHARRLAYFGADAALLASEWINKVDPEKLASLRLTLHPAIQIITSHFPIYDIWHKNQNDANHAVSPHPQEVLITRPMFEVHVSFAPIGTAYFFAQLLAGISLGDAVEATLSKIPEAKVDQIIAITLPHVIAHKE